jgi:chromatin remodeling complex protein RSC6
MAKGSALMQPKNISADLAKVVGNGPMSRAEVVKKLWEYIKKNGLQDATNKRMINADDKLKVIFDGKSQVNMLQMGGFLSKHLS